MGKRDTTKKTILEAASALLMEKGLSETSMEMVASAAACHRRTLYRYFPQREDLLYELVISMLKDMNRFQISFSEGLSGTGIERFSAFLLGLAGYMEEHASMVRFMGEFDFYFNEKRSFTPAEAIRKDFDDVAHVTEEILESIIIIGIEDGSIVLPMEATIFIPTLTTILWGAAQRVALRGRMIEDEFGISGLELINGQINLYLDAIRGRDRS